MARHEKDPFEPFVAKHFPKIKQTDPTSQHQLVLDLSSSVFTTVIYTDVERAEINTLTDPSLTTYTTDSLWKPEILNQLNDHLSSRTTVLGSKPSAADLAIYSRIGPLIADWSPEQRTGKQGYHHIIRYVDFVQNSPVFGITLEAKDKVAIDLKDIRFVPQPIDPKLEKERKKKEKAAAGAAGGTSSEGVLAVNAGKKENRAADGAIPVRTGRKEKAPKQPKAQPEIKPLSPALIDLRIGHILRAVAHPDADSLYVSTIACGDAAGSDNTSLDEATGQTVRTVCSGLNGLIPLPMMQDRKVVVVCNLKPVTMRGVKSAAMVLAASPRAVPGEDEHAGHGGPVELVDVPADAKAGDKVFFEGYNGTPDAVLNPKKKIWESCQVGFTTTADGEVAFEEDKVIGLLGGSPGTPLTGVKKLTTASGGIFKVPTLKGAVVR